MAAVSTLVSQLPRYSSTHIDDPRAVGERVRKSRLAAGLAQKDLVFEGCTAGYISRIENGVRRPSLQVLTRLARILNVSADYLATGSLDDPDPSDPLFEADIALRLGDRDTARDLYVQVVSTSSSPRERARARAGLGRVALEDGDVAQAQELLQAALDSDELDRQETASAADQLGRSYAMQGRYAEAAHVFNRSLEEARHAGDPVLQQRFAILLANTYVDAGNFGRAEEILAAVLNDTRANLDPIARARLAWSQSRLYSSKGDTEQAVHFARMTVGALEHSEHVAIAARALVLLAHIENDRGNADRVLELVEESLPTLQTAGSKMDQTMLLLEKARALAVVGESDAAAALALRVTAMLPDVQPATAARGYATAASVFRQLGDRARALEVYELAAEMLPVSDRHAAEIWSAISELHEEEGRRDEALATMKQAVIAHRNSVLGSDDVLLPSDSQPRQMRSGGPLR